MEKRREFSTEDERKLGFARTLRLVDNAVIAPVGTAPE